MTDDQFLTNRDVILETRADVKELKGFILEALDKKADAKDLEPLGREVASLSEWRVRAERGELTDAQKGAVSGLIMKAFRARSRESWAGWERKIAVGGVFAGLIGAAAGVAAALEVFVR